VPRSVRIVAIAAGSAKLCEYGFDETWGFTCKGVGVTARMVD